MSNIKNILRRSHSLKCFHYCSKKTKKKLFHNFRDNKINLMKVKANRK